MNFISNLIASIPEPLAIAILTATFTGLIIYFLQKRMERTLTREMKEFEAMLQFSNFEQQQKFSAMYPKRVEVLHALYRLYEVFAKTTILELRQVRNSMSSSTRKAMTNNPTFRDSSSKLGEFKLYLQDNRLFLSDDLIKRIDEISQHSFNIVMVALVVKSFEKHQPGSTIENNDVIEVINNLNIKTNAISDGKLDTNKFINDLTREVDNQVLQIERLYKSAAGIT